MSINARASCSSNASCACVVPGSSILVRRACLISPAKGRRRSSEPTCPVFKLSTARMHLHPAPSRSQHTMPLLRARTIGSEHGERVHSPGSGVPVTALHCALRQRRARSFAPPSTLCCSLSRAAPSQSTRGKKSGQSRSKRRFVVRAEAEDVSVQDRVRSASSVC